MPTEKPQQELAKDFIILNDTTAHAYTADRPNVTIDYIYIDRKNGKRYKVVERKVINDTVASDHRPVQVIVAPKK